MKNAVLFFFFLIKSSLISSSTERALQTQIHQKIKILKPSILSKYDYKNIDKEHRYNSQRIVVLIKSLSQNLSFWNDQWNILQTIKSNNNLGGFVYLQQVEVYSWFVNYDLTLNTLDKNVISENFLKIESKIKIIQKNINTNSKGIEIIKTNTPNNELGPIIFKEISNYPVNKQLEIIKLEILKLVLSYKKEGKYNNILFAQEKNTSPEFTFSHLDLFKRLSYINLIFESFENFIIKVYKKTLASYQKCAETEISKIENCANSLSKLLSEITFTRYCYRNFSGYHSPIKKVIKKQLLLTELHKKYLYLKEKEIDLTEEYLKSKKPKILSKFNDQFTDSFKENNSLKIKLIRELNFKDIEKIMEFGKNNLKPIVDFFEEYNKEFLKISHAIKYIQNKLSEPFSWKFPVKRSTIFSSAGFKFKLIDYRKNGSKLREEFKEIFKESIFLEKDKFPIAAIIEDFKYFAKEGGGSKKEEEFEKKRKAVIEGIRRLSSVIVMEFDRLNRLWNNLFLIQELFNKEHRKYLGNLSEGIELISK